MLDGFKKFILRGNVVDMAVGVVIGAAFGGVVTSLSGSLINPLIALLVGKPDFTAYPFKIGQTAFPYGVFVTALHSFSVGCGSDLFLCGDAGECAGGADEPGREAA